MILYCYTRRYNGKTQFFFYLLGIAGSYSANVLTEIVHVHSHNKLKGTFNLFTIQRYHKDFLINKIMDIRQQSKFQAIQFIDSNYGLA